MPSHPALAQAVLAIHLAVIVFNIAMLVLVPTGAALGWAFVRSPALRLIHLASLAIVAVQAVAGRACFLTLWQAALTGRASEGPMIERFVDRLVYWPLPPWVFTALYLAVFAYALTLLWLVPLRRRST